MLSVKDQLTQQKGKIVWLASYPKSGNTWFRSFLTALIEEQLDLNCLKAKHIFSSRSFFDACTGLDSRLLKKEEAENLLPSVYAHFAKETEALAFVKVHDAYQILGNKKALIPAEISQLAIYFIRNPLDIVASFAHHNGHSTSKTVDGLNDKYSSLARQDLGLHYNNQFEQKLLDWSGHVNSWTTQPEIPIHLVRYEDLLENPLHIFGEIVERIGLKVNVKQIERALALSDFSKLKNLEKAHGFTEKNPESQQFFRSGQAGNWKHELTDTQAKEIIQRHKIVMEKYGYLPL